MGGIAWGAAGGLRLPRRRSPPVPRVSGRISVQPPRRMDMVSVVGRRGGLWRLREMLVVGLESHCDRVALHVYDGGIIDELAALGRAPVEITETRVLGVERYLARHRDVFPRIREEIGEVREYATFDELIPDMTLYLPTAELFARVEAAR